MNETAFLMSEQQRAKSVPVHLKARTARWAPSDIELRQDPEYWAGGHGLHSTPRDYLKFQRALLGDGTSPDGVKILDKSTVDAAFRNQIGALDFPAEITTADPASSMSIQRRPGLQVGLRAAAQHRGHPRRAPRLERRLGGPAQHALLGRPHDGRHRRDLHAVPPFVTEDAFQMYVDFEQALYASL